MYASVGNLWVSVALWTYHHLVLSNFLNYNSSICVVLYNYFFSFLVTNGVYHFLCAYWPFEHLPFWSVWSRHTCRCFSWYLSRKREKTRNRKIINYFCVVQSHSNLCFVLLNYVLGLCNYSSYNSNIISSWL